MLYKILLLTFILHYCASKKYENYTLYRAVPVEDSHLQFFINASDEYGINFWRRPGVLFRPIEFTVSPESKAAFLDEAELNNIELTTIIENVQRAFDEQTVKTYIRRKMDSFDWRNYFGLADINNWLKDLKREYPTRIKLKTIGKTYEGRNIYAADIRLPGSRMRSKVFVEGGIHAREWISPAFVTYLLYSILTATESKNVALTKIALTYEWYFVPILNPDGYDYTHKHDRMWRKNRHDGNNGVDINRNFEYGFGTVGVSRQKSSEIYCGEGPFSERESRAMANYVQANNRNIEYYLAFHSYGQYMIIPYAHMNLHVENYNRVRAMGVGAANEIYKRYQTKYSVGTAMDTVGYMTSGVSGCWVKKTFRVPYVITFELRDTGRHGFALPQDEILPTCMETMDGLLSILRPRPSQQLDWDTEDESMSTADSSYLDTIIMISNAFLFIIVWL